MGQPEVSMLVQCDNGIHEVVQHKSLNPADAGQDILLPPLLHQIALHEALDGVQYGGGAAVHDPLQISRRLAALQQGEHDLRPYRGTGK